MKRPRRLVEVAVFAPLGAVATLAAAARRRSRGAPVAAPEPSRPEIVPQPRVVVASSVAVDELPVDGYDHLAASQVVDRLAALTADELELVAEYERAHRHRQSVLAKVAQLTGQLPG